MSTYWTLPTGNITCPLLTAAKIDLTTYHILKEDWFNKDQKDLVLGTKQAYIITTFDTDFNMMQNGNQIAKQFHEKQ